MVVDGVWAVVGSANLDYLSLFVNHELILVAPERRLAEGLHAQYERDLEQAREVALVRWRQRGPVERGLETIGRAARRVL
jgi:cardiolipin synthase